MTTDYQHDVNMVRHFTVSFVQTNTSRGVFVFIHINTWKEPYFEHLQRLSVVYLLFIVF
jgi:hypothetical protein